MIARDVAEAVVREVIAACDPARRVREALAGARGRDGRPGDRTGRRIAFAVGKAALAMARGAGAVDDGIVVVPRGAGGDVPAGWRLLEAAHPEPDATSVAAGEAVRALVRSAAADDAVLALISGGASSLIEVPLGGLEAFVGEIRAVMASGAPIAELNLARKARSAIKGGRLAELCAAPILTLAVSDVIGDDLAVIGSGPTIAGRPQDIARVIAPMASAAEAAVVALASRGIIAQVLGPIDGAPDAIARRLVDPRDPAIASGAASRDPASRDPASRATASDPAAGAAGPRAVVAWGEPTLALPADHGVGGRAQQLALLLARALRGSARSALVVGTDGVDGPPPPDRPAPAGAWVDGSTWDAIRAAGRDPEAALACCDAGPALAAVGALIVTGPSGINHADLVVLG